MTHRQLYGVFRRNDVVPRITVVQSIRKDNDFSTFRQKFVSSSQWQIGHTRNAWTMREGGGGGNRTWKTILPLSSRSSSKSTAARIISSSLGIWLCDFSESRISVYGIHAARLRLGKRQPFLGEIAIKDIEPFSLSLSLSRSCSLQSTVSRGKKKKEKKRGRGI